MAQTRTTASLRRLLAEIARAERLRSDALEEELGRLAAEVRAWPPGEALELLDRAAGASKSRRKAAMFVLSNLAKHPAVVERIRRELLNPDPEIRSLMLNAICFKKLVELAPYLNDVILDESCPASQLLAIDVAGALRQEVNFPAILRLACEGFPGLSSVLTEYGRDEGREYLQREFLKDLPLRPTAEEMRDQLNIDSFRKVAAWRDARHEKLIAAWGLAKLGDRAALAHVGEHLFDSRDASLPGSETIIQLRAAQALADLFGLPFRWHTDDLPVARAWWEANRDRLLGGERPES